MTFSGKMTLWLGKLEVQLLQLGRGHTKGDTVAWLPQQKILFSGDLVEFDATPYAGDAYFKRLAADAGQHQRHCSRPSWCPGAARR
jgi:glyoxylase-like metal-dependent hydrolase (beta-lactamase superfamily II)